MAHETLERIEESAAYFEEHAEEAEQLGRIPDATAKEMRASGIVRLLQPVDFGGYEAEPAVFLEAVMALASKCGASGWVAGVVGTHPWELALGDRRAQEDVWGDDPDTWMASPYITGGKARPADGGYIFNGRWPFSSGTDQCQWVLLGGAITDENGETTPESPTAHFLLPRSDYEIIDDSWDVVGLRGTGSKDVVIRDAFVPTYRTIDEVGLIAGDVSRNSPRDAPLYHMPWSGIFPPSVTAGVVGMAYGALGAVVAYQRGRVNAFGSKVVDDAAVMYSIGEAASEIDASRLQLIDNARQMYDIVANGQEVPYELRAKGRRDQVRAGWRAVKAVDALFDHSGGHALRMSKPLQRFWRDAHAGLHHMIHLPSYAYETYTASLMGIETNNPGRFIL